MQAFTDSGAGFLGFQPSILFIVGVVLLFSAMLWHHGRRIRRLERQLINQHRFFRRELKMVNQSSIGLGQRVQRLEKQLRREPGAFEALLKQQVESDNTPESRTPPVTEQPAATRPEPSQAERNLANWLRDYQNTA